MVHSRVVVVLSLGCIVASGFLLILVLLLSLHRFRKNVSRVSLVDTVKTALDNYLSYINSRKDTKLYWITEKHLYWIEVRINKN